MRGIGKLPAGGRLGDIEAAFSQSDPIESIRIVICCFARFWDFDRTAMRRLRSLARSSLRLAR